MNPKLALPNLARLLRKHRARFGSIPTMLRGFHDPFKTVAIFLGVSRDDTPVIRIRGTDLQFRVRGRMDAWCLKETLLDRCYEQHGFAIQPGWTILDIGAGIGDFTVLASRDASEGHVLAWEPNTESFALLRENLRANLIANAEPSNAAVTGAPAHLALDTSSDEPLMFASVKRESGDAAKAIPIHSITLAEIIAQHDLTTIDLLKLDCEGGEYDILLNSPPEAIAPVQRIVMEYHDHTTNHHHRDLVNFLADSGFEVESTPNPVHPELIGYLRAWRRNA